MSDETKWTKGPWGTDEDSGFPLDVHREGTAVMVCRVNESKKGQANAHLIAAAPELYAALEESVASRMNQYGRAPHNWISALAKARGES